MLAPVNGSERFMSVSCGHTAQFCKAAIASCKTPQSTLADVTGHLNVQIVMAGDKALQTMLEKGWAWTIIPWQVEAQWPTLADLAQRALNASNSVASQCSELEVAASIAEFAAMEVAMTGSVDWKRCGAAAAAGMPPCTPYIDSIVEYVRLYGGGSGAPMVRYIDAFSKRFGENKRLGEDFFEAVTDVFFGPARRCPHIRTALMAGNLVSPKIVDGISKLLVKADVERVKSKDKAAVVDQTESMMSIAWSITDQLCTDGVMSHDELHPVMGRFHTRAALWLVGKGKLGFEKKDYKTLDEILEAFVDDVAAVLPAGHVVEHDWFKHRSAAPPVMSATAVVPKSGGPVNMNDLGDVNWHAPEAGLIIGKVYFQKSVGPSAGLYVLKKISDKGCELEEHSVTKPTTMQATIPIERFMTLWSEYKGSLQVQLQGYCGSTVQSASRLHLDRNKAVVLEGLFQAAVKHDAINSLAFYINPNEVRVVEKVAKGKLTLVPATSHDKVTVLKGPVQVQVGRDTLYVSEPPKPRTTCVADWKHEVIIVPFWWVCTTSNEDEVNMVEKTVKDVERKLVFTVLVNNRPLQPT